MRDLNLTDFTNDGVCSRCGACCSDFLPLTSSEVKKLRRWVKKHHFKPIRNQAPIGTEQLVVDVTCPFLQISDSGTECAVYKIRPKVCQQFVCKGAIEGSLPEFKNQNAYKVVSIRREVFGDSEAITLPEYLLLLDYIKKRPKEAKNA